MGMRMRKKWVWEHERMVRATSFKALPSHLLVSEPCPSTFRVTVLSHGLTLRGWRHTAHGGARRGTRGSRGAAPTAGGGRPERVRGGGLR